MNIGIVTTWFERGAAYVSKQYKQLLEQRHNVFIFARGGETKAINDPTWDSHEVTWQEKQYGFVYTSIGPKEFDFWIDENKIEVVLFNEQHSWDIVVHCAKRGIKTASYIDYYTEQTIPFFDCYDFLICNTKRHHSAFQNHPQAYYVPWGTDLELFKPQQYKAVNPEAITFFHSAGVTPDRKGTDLVIEAFSQLSDSSYLVIHSQQNLKKYFPRLRPLIESLEASKRLICYEQTITAPGLFHLGDVYVYPSRLEGIGLTMAEGLACGLPLITTNNGPMNEFVTAQSGKVVEVARLFSRSDGYYWPQSIVDLPSLVAQMRHYVENFEKIEQFKKQARQYAETNLNWQNNASTINHIFETAELRNISDKSKAIEAATAYENRKKGPAGRAVDKYKLLRPLAQWASEALKK